VETFLTLQPFNQSPGAGTPLGSGKPEKVSDREMGLKRAGRIFTFRRCFLY